MKSLGIDMDDVTADLVGKIVELENLSLGKEEIVREDLKDWYMNWDLYKRYYLDPEVYKELDVMDKAKEVLEELSSKYDIYFVTASPNADITKVKMEWVDMHFDFIGSDKVIATRHKHIIRTDLLFDDSPSFLPNFSGVRVLRDQVYNQHLIPGKDYDYRVNGWEEFKDILDLVKENNKLYGLLDGVGEGGNVIE